MNKQDKIQQIKYFAKDQIEAEDIDQHTLIVSDPKQAFIGMAVASQHPDTNVVFEGEAEAAVNELIGLTRIY
jgi:hypothetical protein